jgi:CheY-like chemotaxis protein
MEAADQKASHRPLVESSDTLKRVLIVEDYADDVLLIERVFKRLPVEVETMHVEDGREAVLFSEVWNPLDEFFDLVLLDSRVPGATGLELLKALRRSDPEGKVPIVLLIGASGEDFSEVALGYGANACVVKPLEPEAFMTKVRRIAETWLELDSA